jgi:hypothetical protein
MTMQTVDSNVPYSSSGSEDIGQLRKKLQGIVRSPYLPNNEVRDQLRNMILRIDLETATPSAKDPVTELGLFIIQSIQALRHNQILTQAVDEDLRKLVLLIQRNETTPEALVIHCQLCGHSHKLESTEFSFDRPDVYYYLFPYFPRRTDVADRIHSARDFMAIDRARFFIRGNLHMQLQRSDEKLNLGVWAEVEHGQFAKYVDRTLSKLEGKSFKDQPLMIKGRLANRLYCYPESFNQPVEINCSSQFGLASIAITTLDSALSSKLNEGLNAVNLSLTFSSFAHNKALLHD